MIKNVHQDKGGSILESQMLNSSRDILLGKLKNFIMFKFDIDILFLCTNVRIQLIVLFIGYQFDYFLIIIRCRWSAQNHSACLGFSVYKSGIRKRNCAKILSRLEMFIFVI